MSVKIEYKKFGEFLVCDKHCLNADVCEAKPSPVSQRLWQSNGEV